MKRCLICGEEFVPEHNAQRICKKDHVNKCPVCGKQLIWNYTRQVKPCCKECSNELRRATNLKKYDVINAGQIKKSRASHDYDNFKYIQSMDKKYAELWKSYGVDVYKWAESGHPTGFYNIIDPSQLSVYVITNSMDAKIKADNFLQAQGVQCPPKKFSTGITVALCDQTTPVQAIRIGLSKYKNYSCELVDFGKIMGHDVPGGYQILMNTFTQMYEIESMIAVIDNYDGLDVDMQEMGFTYQFDRPGLIYWNNEILYKRTDNIGAKLSEGFAPVVHSVRKVYALTRD